MFDTADPISRALRHARPFEVERLAIRIGHPEGEIRSWRHGALGLPAWHVRAIADILGLDDAALEQHRQCRRRHQDEQASLACEPTPGGMTPTRGSERPGQGLRLAHWMSLAVRGRAHAGGPITRRRFLPVRLAADERRRRLSTNDTRMN